MSDPRKASISLTWNGVDVTRRVEPYIIDLSYSDHLSGTADDLSIEFHDRDELWSGDWRPSFNDTAVATIKCDPWFTVVDTLRFGSFSHDSASHSGPPRRVSVKCVSAALSTGIRRHRKNKKWSGVTLREIAQDIASAANLKLYWSGPETHRYRRREQKDQSDLEFLSHECTEAGFALKVTEGQIAIFEEAEREKVPPLGVIDLQSGRVISWSFDDGKTDHYGRCRVSCTDPRTGKPIEGIYRDPDDDGPTLEVKRAVQTKGEAELIAKGLLRAANRGAAKGKLVLVGDAGFYAGAVFDITGARKFNGRYIVEKAEHHPVGGYTVNLDMHRVLEGY